MQGKSGRYLPYDKKVKFANERLTLGAVILRHEDSLNPPKEKFSIIVGMSNDSSLLATVYINSKINDFIKSRQELHALQFEISVANCPCLSYTSYADCSDIVQRDYKELFDEVTNNLRIMKGALNTDLLNQIRQTLVRAGSIKGKLKKKFDLFSKI
jgi:hypothetical protein